MLNILIQCKHFLILVLYNLTVQSKSVFIGLKDAEGCNVERLMKPELLNMQLLCVVLIWVKSRRLYFTAKKTVFRRGEGNLHHVGISRTSVSAYESRQKPEDVRGFSPTDF